MNNTLFKIEQLKLNNLKDRVNSYKNYLDGLDIIDISDARLMAYKEATAIGCSIDNYSCPEYASNQNYWLGSAYRNDNVFSVYAYDRKLDFNYYHLSDGVRPVIFVSQSDIPTA